MRILWVKANKLLPMHSGGDIRSYHMARYLSSRHQLCFLSYYDGRRDADYERQLEEHFPGSCCICTEKSQSLTARAIGYFARLPDAVPYAVSRFRSAPVRAKLEASLAGGQFDVAVCDFLDAAVNFPTSSTPTVLFQHNVESEIWRRHFETETNPVKRLIYRMESSKMLAYEKSAMRSFPRVVAVSENDKRLMSEWVSSSRITVIPTGVDLQQYRPDFTAPKTSSVVVFIGAMDWEPNVDAMEFFCREIWPAVAGKIPAARFRIVGRNPVPRVKQLACDSVEVTGRVPVVLDYLRDAAAVVVPLRIGGGTRLKIYEAMAAGKAIVSTSIGAEGLDVHHGQDIILADTPPAFSEAVVKLLQNEQIRQSYEREAAELAAKYDWSAVGARFEEVLEEMSGSRDFIKNVVSGTVQAMRTGQR